jgi:hypothetical protein
MVQWRPAPQSASMSQLVVETADEQSDGELSQLESRLESREQSDGSCLELAAIAAHFCKHMKSLGAQASLQASTSKPAHWSKAALSVQE